MLHIIIGVFIKGCSCKLLPPIWLKVTFKQAALIKGKSMGGKKTVLQSGYL